jgi:RHS repeat-associated protein
MIARDRNADGSATTGTGGLEERVYAIQDANWNTTAIIAATGVTGLATGTVINRFAYTPYGESQTLTASWTSLPAGSTPAVPWAHLFQGLEFTDVTALAYVRHRDYSATLGRFIELDPIGFSAGDNNWYRFVGNGPTDSQDAYGLEQFELENGRFDVSVTDRRRRRTLDTWGVAAEIKFTPKAEDPCSDMHIKLLQFARVKGPGRLHVENPKTKDGWMVDNVTKLYKKGKESPFYNDYVRSDFWEKDGKVTCKNIAGGPGIRPAKLRDIPGFLPITDEEQKQLTGATMEFETVAVEKSSGKVLGAVTWSFTLAYDKAKRDHYAIPGPIAAHESASNNATDALALWNKRYGKQVKVKWVP